MTRPRLSICIATYNRAGLLREALTNLTEVCDDDIEIVVSDNASPDDTQGVINSFAGRLIPSPIDQNPCAQSRNPMDMILQG